MITFLCDVLWWVILLLLIPAVTLLMGKWVDMEFYTEPKKQMSTASKQQEKEKEEKNGNQKEEKEKENKNGNSYSACSCACACVNENNSSGDANNNNNKKNKKKDILIAYATQSNTACKLAHKLFSTVTAALYEAQAENEKAAGNSKEENIDNCCSSNNNNNNNNIDMNNNNNGCCSDKSRDVPEVKVLQLSEDAHQCSAEHLLESGSYGLVVLIVSTYTNGTAPGPSQAFAEMLLDAYNDFRVSRDVFAQTKFAVFGLGDIAYGDVYFNRFAKNLYTWCKGLGGNFVVPPVYASEANTVALFNVFSVALMKWIGRVRFTADGVVVINKKKKQQQQEEQLLLLRKNKNKKDEDGVPRVNAERDSEEDDDDDDEENNNNNNNNNNSDSGEEEDDMENLVMDDMDQSNSNSNNDPPELLYPRLRANLQRQGYHLIGSHSGVKLCRWTKAMLRGRGGCYKHTFYNIASHQCMEMTPSLACANKCVFCWRHHTNPVGRSFRWRVDPPELLISEAINGHQRMLKQMRGVPGVTAEKLEEAMRVRHCALSLVGEPIMYPAINEFVDLLHVQHISSFMVTNAQFPDQLRDLKPVTQLYLSIDAPTPEELKRVDRPLFEDYWERCLACVRELRRKPQRTVFRLTLVNAYNTENIAAYADLVRLGWPDFIEVKGVTYCGTSSTSTLTMKENVPRHVEVVEFCQALCAALMNCTPPRDKTIWMPTTGTTTTGTTGDNNNNNNNNNDDNNDNNDANIQANQADIDNNNTNTDNTNTTIEQEEKEEEATTTTTTKEMMDTSSGPYSIACEHEHSCCVLIALRRFCVNGVWHTWIDYDKFMQLAHSGRKDFTAAEYAAPTPSWAVFRSQEKGFDPQQERVHRKSGKPVVITSGC